jgi:hypothetical protein
MLKFDPAEYQRKKEIRYETTDIQSEFGYVLVLRNPTPLLVLKSNIMPPTALNSLDDIEPLPTEKPRGITKKNWELMQQAHAKKMEERMQKNYRDITHDVYQTICNLVVGTRDEAGEFSRLVFSLTPNAEKGELHPSILSDVDSAKIYAFAIGHDYVGEDGVGVKSLVNFFKILKRLVGREGREGVEQVTIGDTQDQGPASGV